MSCDLKYCLALFELLEKSEKKVNKNKIIKLLKCEKCLNKALHELTVNLIAGNLSLSEKQKKLLKNKKFLIKKLSNTPTKNKKTIKQKELSKYCKYFEILKPSLKTIVQDNV